MLLAPDRLRARLAATEDDLRAVQRLRYDVFVDELGAGGEGVYHAGRREADRFDAHAEHLLLEDRSTGAVVGAHRLMTDGGARAAGGFYGEGEFDLTPLRRTGRPLLELGRSCLAPSARGGPGMHLIWREIARLVEDRGIGFLFGVASFHGADPARHRVPLAWLGRNRLAPEGLRPVAIGPQAAPLDPDPAAPAPRAEAVAAMPALLKGYLRLGAVVGEGAWLDRPFATTDVCVVLDAARVPAAARARYAA
ncbi:MAG: GNAT family N-acetyltransferase [Hasllibacter sp.]